MNTIFKEERFSIIEHSNMDELSWDQFVFENRYGFVYYRYNYLLKDEEENTINKSFIVLDNATRTILALCPLFVKIVSGSVEKIFCRNGILIKDDLGSNLRKKLADCITAHIYSYLGKADNKVISAEIPALAILENNNSLINPLIYFGFKPGIRYTWITCIKGGPDALLSGFEPSTRRDIQKLDSLNEYYLEEILDSTKTLEDRFDDLLLLCRETYHRNNVNAKCEDYYRNIYYNLDINYRRIFFLRRKSDDSAVVVAVFFIYGNKAHYDIGASISQKMRGGSKLLIYKSFLRLRDLGIDYVEMGGAYPYLPLNDKLRGISDFKKCFGCDLYPMLLGEMSFHSD